LSEDLRSGAFPSVFLTLISIVIALGIEQLLGHVSVQIAGTTGVARFLVAAQGVAMFLVVGSIWIAYATQVMAAVWEPRFQDFFVPLFILTLLYFSISAIGTNKTAWFYLVAAGWAFAALAQRFTFPEPTAARLKPNSPEARRSILCLLTLSVLAALGGVATQTGVLGATASAVWVCVLAAIQLLQAWLQFRWWRAA
jgi:hypothetical protein